MDERTLSTYFESNNRKISRMKKYIVTVICLLIFYTIQAQVTRKYSNDFMSIGVGARGLAMSNAQVAGVSDITAGYYNPAGLVYVNNNIWLFGQVD